MKTIKLKVIQGEDLKRKDMLDALSKASLSHTEKDRLVFEEKLTAIQQAKVVAKSKLQLIK